MEEQRGPGRHPATAPRIQRRKWCQYDNRVVMECYYQSEPKRNGYRKRMHKCWVDKGMFPVTEQRLLDQKNNIIKRNWVTDLELEEMRRNIEALEQGTMLEAAEADARETCNIELPDRSSENEEIDNSNESNVNVNEEEKILIKRLKDILSNNERERLRSLRGVEKGRLQSVVQKVDTVLGKMKTDNITDTNNLIYAGAVLAQELLGLRKTYQSAKREPWWKRRLEGRVKELCKDLSRVNIMMDGEKIKQRHRTYLQEKYKIKQKGIATVKEEISQRIKATVGKIKRYSNRINQYQQNRTFRNNQGKFYQDLNRGGKHVQKGVPDLEAAKKFWEGIWGAEKVHNDSAEWLEQFRNEMKRQRVEQGVVNITDNKIQHVLKKIPNWKAPGPDGVQGFWVKNFRSMHKPLRKHLEQCLEVGTPNWMTKGRTILIQKDKKQGNAANNYRPITCLPILWKLLTGVIANELYEYLESNSMLPEEQKGCRRKTRGTHDLLYIDRMVLKEVKQRKKGLAMGWIDYRKAYDMIAHSWILESLKGLGVNRQIREFLQESMKTWRVELTCGEQILGEVKINRGIFQGDTLSPLLFVTALIPLTHILRKSKAGYEFSKTKVKVNHLLYMDDLKLYAKNEKSLDSLLQTVRIFSKDIGMEFGIDKCAMLSLKRGNIVASDGIKLPDKSLIKSMKEGESYKYLGILQTDRIWHKEMKIEVGREYKRRVRKLLETKLNGGNLVKGINTWAISLLRYSAAFLDWTKAEVEQLDRRTRKLMTMHNALHPKSNVDRLYLPRKDGGRGLLGVEDTVHIATASLQRYVRKSTEKLLSSLATIEGDEVIEPDSDLKQQKRMERKESWKEKALHGQFLRQTDEIAGDARWLWLKHGNLKRETESLILAAQEQAIRTNAIKAYIDKSQEQSKCRKCGERDETVNHLVSECSKMAQREYKRRHDWVARRVHWEVCRMYGIEVKDKWCEHDTAPVTENERCKILWDFNIQTDHIIQARRPDMIVINKKDNAAQVIDFAVPHDSRVDSKEIEKIEKYQDLVRELKKLWDMKIVVIPIVIGALGTTPKTLPKRLKDIGIKSNIGELQKTVILNTARILRKVLEV